MIACISDTHRGIRERLVQGEALASFLEYARAHAWQLLFLGDIVDLWKVPPDEAMETDGAIIRMLADYPDYLWVPGNHDADVTAMRSLGFKLPDEVKEYLRIGDYLCFHGHQLDSLLDSQYERDGAAFLDRIGYDLRDFGALNAIRAMIDHGHRNNRELRHRSIAWGPVVTGHTHLAEATDDERFINAGCWTGEEGFHYVLFDGDNNPTLVEWRG